MQRRLEEQLLEHTSPEKLRLLHAANAISLRVRAETHLPLSYRDVLLNVLGALATTLETSHDVGHWRAATECWNSLVGSINNKFPLPVPLHTIEPPHIVVR